MSLNPQFYFLGDSLTEFGSSLSTSGWLLQLQDAYLRKAEILNRGYSGYNTQWYKEAIFSELIEIELKFRKDQTKVITLFLGANDAVDQGALQHISLEIFEQNLKFMIQELQKIVPEAIILLITPPPINENSWYESRLIEEPQYQLNRRNTSIQKYAEVTRNLSQEFNCNLIDLWKVFKVNDTNIFFDGLHFNSIGNTILKQAWLDKLKEVKPEFIPENLPFVKKVWREFTN